MSCLSLEPRVFRRLVPFLCLPILLLSTGCGDEPAAPDLEPEAPPVEAVQASIGSLPLEERLSGVVRARNQVEVRPEIEAPIVEVAVRSGEAVEQGLFQATVCLDVGLRDQSEGDANRAAEILSTGDFESVRKRP